MRLNTAGYPGPLSKSARVYSNDLLKKIQVITVKADVQVPIAVSTPYLYFAGPSDSVIAKTVEIESRDEATIQLEVLSFDLDEKLTYNIEEVLPGKLFRVTVSTIPEKAGTYMGSLRLQTTHPKKPDLTIRIRGRIMKRPANQTKTSTDEPGAGNRRE